MFIRTGHKRTRQSRFVLVKETYTLYEYKRQSGTSQTWDDDSTNVVWIFSNNLFWTFYTRLFFDSVIAKTLVVCKFYKTQKKWNLTSSRSRPHISLWGSLYTRRMGLTFGGLTSGSSEVLTSTVSTQFLYSQVRSPS